MSVGKRLLMFGGGSVVGAAVGAAVGGLLAPQRGEDLQRQTRSLIEEAQREGDRAAAETERALVQRFRARVDDPVALRGEGAEG